MADYDIGEAFREIENELVASLRRNLEKYADVEDYTMWQVEQLKALERFRQENVELFSERFAQINAEVEKVLNEAYDAGDRAEVKRFEKAIEQGHLTVKPSAGFFGVNEANLRALVKATTNDLQAAEIAMLRMVNDVYRKTIFNAQVAASSGAFTMRQSIDMATRDFLAKGISCVEYSNGARVGIDSYAEMALRTASTRAKLQGETNARDEAGVNTVIVNRRGVACPKCIRFCGKVFYDDVYSGLPVTDDKYPRLSKAIEGGLYHPNCKDSHSTYYEGISTPPQRLTEAEIEEANRVYELEQKQRYNERQIRKYKRLEAGSLDADNQARYAEKVKQWQKVQRDFISENEGVLRRRYAREQI